MTRIGLLSDTHGWLDQKILDFFSSCHEIWHAGDIGDISIPRSLGKDRTFRAVHGNIDFGEIRTNFPAELTFRCEEADIFMIHISGYPGRYARGIVPVIKSCRPSILVGGHSHILKIIYDKKYHLLHLNPGAAGRSGFHQVRTALRFGIHEADVRDMEVLELPR